MPLGAHKAALFGVAGVSDSGTAVLLSTATASDDASIEFTLPTAYKQVKFGFYNVTPATDATALSFQVNASGGSGYNETITSTFFRADHAEDDSQAYLQYYVQKDQAQGTAYQTLGLGVGNGADECCVGELHIFSPASTTYVKNFYATMSVSHSSSWGARENLTGGYINTTTNLSEIAFKFSSGNISSGVIRMWGIS